MHAVNKSMCLYWEVIKPSFLAIKCVKKTRCSQDCSTTPFVILSFIKQEQWPFSSKSSKHCLSQTVREKELKFWENIHPPLCVTCQVSGARSQVSGDRCQVLGVRYHVSGVRCQVTPFFMKALHKLSQFLAAALADWPYSDGRTVAAQLWVDYISWSAYEGSS